MDNALAAQIHARLPADSILGSLDEAELTELLAFAVRKKIGRGSLLFEAGDDGDSMLVVLDGTLKVFVVTANGREIVLNYVSRGGIIGEIAMLDGGPRTANVSAVDATEVLLLQRRHLLPFLEHHLDAALRVIAVLCRHLRHANEMIEASTGMAMGPRLARGLLRLVDEHAVTAPDGMRVLTLTQGDIASFVGLSRENVNRQLREWEQDGFVKLGRGQITVRAADALREIADNFD